LNFNSHRIKDEGYTKLSETISQLKSLKQITLNLGDLEKINSAVLTKLTGFGLSFYENRGVDEKDLIILDGAIAQLPNVTKLILTCGPGDQFEINKGTTFEAGAMAKLTQCLDQIKNLTQIIFDFRQAEIAEKDWIILSEWLAKHQNLTQVDLRFDGDITDAAFTTLTASISKLEKQTELRMDFSGCPKLQNKQAIYEDLKKQLKNCVTFNCV